jgi:hypothetical protein
MAASMSILAWFSNWPAARGRRNPGGFEPLLCRDFDLLAELLGSAVRGTGNMALPAGVTVGSVLGHIVVSPVLIFDWGPIPGLGPAGAGWGS